MFEIVLALRNRRAQRDLSEDLSARRETGGTEVLKFREPCGMAIPSQARSDMAGKV